MLKDLARIRSFFSRHPLTRDRKWEAYKRFVKWQIASRLTGKAMIIPFVDPARLIVQQGVTSATGNYYVGLAEFNDMAFVLHFLRPDDFFLDAGANVGVYTVLASGVRAARTMSFEPIPSTYARLVDHVRLNDMAERVSHFNMALGSKEETLVFTSDEDCTNHVLPEGADTGGNRVEVKVRDMDSVLEGKCPLLMKIDVEGFETQVIGGAQKTLTNSQLKAIIIELNGLGARYGFDDEAIHRQLLDMGFKPYHYEPFNRALKEAAQYGSHNTIYIRDPEWVKKRIAEGPKVTVLGKSF